MSYPREEVGANRPPKPSRPRHRHAQGMPFDPDELSRRLYNVLAEQKAEAARRRRARELEKRTRDHLASKQSDSPREAAQSSRPDAPSSSTPGQSSGSKSAAKKTPHNEPAQPPAPRGAAESSGSRPTVPNSFPQRRGSKLHLTTRSAARRAPSQANRSDVAAETASEGASEYHHVPSQAASQFARTTTSTGMRDGSGEAHRLSKRALKYHLEGAQADASTGPSGTRALRKAQNDHDKVFERNQFQRSRILDAAAAADNEREQRQHRHTFEGDLGFHRPEEQQYANRRNSTGNLLQAVLNAGDQALAGHDDDGEVFDPSTAHEHRVDWSQSDELLKSKPPEAKGTPLLRKADSIWALRGRLGSFGKQTKEEKPPSSGSDEHSPPPQSTQKTKSPNKIGFLARFKRQTP